MTQPWFPGWDPAEGERRKQAGMDNAAKAADPAWLLAAFDAIHEACVRFTEVDADVVWEVLDEHHVPRPREPRALGPVMTQAAGMGWMEPLGQQRSRRPPRHRGWVATYRSVIYGQTNGRVHL